MNRPADTEFAPAYGTYISLVPETDVLNVLESQPKDVRDFAATIAPDREQFRYGPDKWTIRQVLGHLIDGERVFGYRAFVIGRGEEQPLHGFDQDDYIAASHFEARPLAALANEFAIVRDANLIALHRLSEKDWDRRGNASGHPVSVRALAYMMAGHVRHHMKILEEKYGPAS